MEEIEITLTTRDGLEIFARAWSVEEPARVLVCVQGLGGHGGYYEVVARHLATSGTVVVAPDLRGHGRSQGTRGDIARFEHYLEDIETTLAWVRGRWPGLPVVLLGESMGASIAIQYIARGGEQAAALAGLALVSPVLRPSIKPTLNEAVRYLRALLAPWRPSMRTTGREELGCRDAAFNERLRADPLFVRLVSVRFLNNLSFWLLRARRQGRRITLPLLVLQGECDYVAHPAGTAAFVRSVTARRPHVVTIPDAYHCLLYDPATPEVMQTLATWLAAHTSGERGEANMIADALDAV